jgi:hypothetical protein
VDVCLSARIEAERAPGENLSLITFIFAANGAALHPYGDCIVKHVAGQSLIRPNRAVRSLPLDNPGHRAAKLCVEMLADGPVLRFGARQHPL